MSRRKLFTFCIIASQLLGCSDSTEFTSISGHPQIIEGHPVQDENLKRATVWVRGQKYPENCSGTYMGNGIIWTAAHCIKDNPTYRVVFYHPTEKSIRCPVLSQRSHPQFDPKFLSNPEFDMAVLKIDEKNCGEGKLLNNPYFQVDFDHNNFKTIQAAGYGRIRPESPFQFPFLQETVIERMTSLFEIDFGELDTADLRRKITRLQNHIDEGLINCYKKANIKGIAPGDSGGPNFYYNERNELVLSELTSFVFVTKEYVKTQWFTCNSRLTHLKDWLLQ